jgi:hypothetical protein
MILLYPEAEEFVWTRWPMISYVLTAVARHAANTQAVAGTDLLASALEDWDVCEQVRVSLPSC